VTTGIGEKIKELRQKKLMSILDVAKKSEVDVSTISKIESGETPRPRERTLAKIAPVFGMTPEEFSTYIMYSENMKKSEEKVDVQPQLEGESDAKAKESKEVL
jgi:transcriptional regulator with XRE-family HTH domain